MTTTLYESIFEETARLLYPLAQAVDSEEEFGRLLGALGLDLDMVPGLDLSPLLSALVAAAAAAEQLSQAKNPQTFADIAAALESVSSVFAAVRQLGGGLSTAGVPSELPRHIAQLGARLADYLVARWLMECHPIAYSVAELLALVDRNPPDGTVVSTSTGLAYLPTPVATINTARLLQLLKDPAGMLKAQYVGSATGSHATAALAGALWPRTAALLERLAWPAIPGTDPRLRALTGDLGQAGDQVADESLLVPIATDDNGDVLLLSLSLVGAQTAGQRSQLVLTVAGVAEESLAAGRWQVHLQAAGALQSLAVDSAGTVFVPVSAGAGDSLSLRLTATRSTSGATPAILVGAASGSRLEIGTVAVSVAAQFSGSTSPHLQVELAASQAQLVVDFSDGDGFLRSLATRLLGGPAKVAADVALGWSRQRGMYLHAGSSSTTNGAQSLVAKLPVNLDFGPVRVPAITVRLTPADDQLTLSAGVDATFNLGPVTATVVGLGLKFTASAPAGGGNVGPMDVQLGLQHPSGVGLAVSGPAVSGSGFLLCDPGSGQYLGAVELTVGDISIDAVGVLTTRIEAGSGYSLVVLASAKFLPVQLGFGFSLVGLGGLIGVNRTMNVPRLQELARAGALDDLMFPADLAHNAPRVAADLERYFPQAQGQFVVGPTVRLTWGASAFLTADIAVLIELPAPLRVALLGSVHIVLPEPGAATVDITLDVLGLVDLDRRTLSIDAGLRDSRIAGFTLTGQAAVRARWGANPTFVLAIGGFNPYFAAPAGFPVLARVALALGGDNPRLRLQSYLALTPNTLQFGASADLYAKKGAAAVGATLRFDALVQYKPLKLQVDLSVAATVLLNGSALMTLALDLHLTGPEPWHVVGNAHFQLLFVSFTVPIDLSVGPSARPPTVVMVDVVKELLGQLTDQHNWQMGPPRGRGVVMVRREAQGGAAVHPLATLMVRQRLVPLGQVIDRMGPDLLPVPVQLDLTGPTLGGVGVGSTAVTDYFAPAQYKGYTDAEKLSAPSFDPMTAGLEIGPAAVVKVADEGNGSHIAVVVPSTRKWTTLTLDSPDPGSTTAIVELTSSEGTSTAPSETLVASQLGGSAAAVKGAGSRGAAAYAGVGSGIEVTPPTYAAVLPTLGFAGGTVLTQLPSYVAASAQVAHAARSGLSIQVVYSSELPGSTGNLAA